MENKLYAKISVRLFTDDKCFGPGIAALLRRVDKYHSLRSAAASMGMAYSKAWTILKSCEQHLGFKLVNKNLLIYLVFKTDDLRLYLFGFVKPVSVKMILHCSDK